MPKLIDLTGHRFGRLTVLTASDKRDSSGNVYWKCACDCGAFTVVQGRSLRTKDDSRRVESCGCKHRDYLSQASEKSAAKVVGRRFDRLVVLRRESVCSTLGSMYVTQCDCGTVKTVRGASLFSGATRSCGCLNKERLRRADITGRRSGQVTALAFVDTVMSGPGRYHAQWACRCDCGTLIKLPARYITHGAIKHCGCGFQSDVQKRLSARISEGMRNALRNGKKRASWESLVDYTVEELRLHLERQFLPGMNWGNMGDWHIDHIVPKSAFAYIDPSDESFQACWALPNLRPLWAADNVAKSDKRLFLI